MAGSALKARAPRASKTPQLVGVNDLTAGVDLRRSQTLLQPQRARTLLNFSLEEPGALVVRPGWQAASSASYGLVPQGGQRVYLASTAFTVMALDGAVYRPTDAWVRGAAVYSTISSGTQVFFPHDRDLVMVMDGANRPRFSTNGTNWFLSGTDAPSTGPALSSAVVSTATLSTGKFAVAVAHKHRGTGYESNVGPESTITITSTASQTAISVTPVASTDPKVDAYVVYARHKLPDQESVLRKVSSAAIGSTLTITSSNWTSNDEAPTNHYAPPALSFGVVWKNRWWARDAVVGNRLRFTEIFLPQAWPTDYTLDIPFERGDSITALLPLGDTLLVFGQSGLHLVIGQTSLDFEVRPSQGADTGAFGPRAVARVEQAVIHVSADGTHSFDGAADSALGYDIRPAWSDLVGNASQQQLQAVACVYDANRKELRVSVSRVFPTGVAGEWALNLDRTRENEGVAAWATTDRVVGFYMHWNGNEAIAGNRNRLFSIASSGGRVMEENVGTAANGADMRAEYEGPGLSMGAHVARFVGTHFEFEPHGGALSAEAVVDGVSQGSTPVDSGTGLAVYGSAVYGTSVYAGAGRRKRFILWPATSEGRSYVQKLVYSGQERAKVFGYAVEAVPEPAPRRMGE